MDTSIVILIAVLIAGFLGFVVFYLTKQMKDLKADIKNDENNVLMEWLKDMKGSVDKNSEVLERQLKDQRETLDQQMRAHREAMNQQTKLIWERLDVSQNVIRDVQKQLGGLQEFGNDMKDLSNVLKSPKLRGGLGEQFLYEILENYMPKEMYATQYKFRDGAACDAVVFTDKGIIPIDSKFPMENFKLMVTAESQVDREKFKKIFVGDVKKRIEEIAGKYILPAEKTTEQAVMYIPSENVYYELIVNTPEIEDYAKKKNVVMTSPNTLAYFLKVILVAYQQSELQKHASEILKSLSGIKIEAEKFSDDLDVLEKHISNSYKSMDGIKNRFTKLFGRIESVHQLDTPEQNGQQKKLLEE